VISAAHDVGSVAQITDAAIATDLLSRAPSPVLLARGLAQIGTIAKHALDGSFRRSTTLMV